MEFSTVTEEAEYLNGMLNEAREIVFVCDPKQSVPCCEEQDGVAVHKSRYYTWPDLLPGKTKIHLRRDEGSWSMRF